MKIVDAAHSVDEPCEESVQPDPVLANLLQRQHFEKIVIVVLLVLCTLVIVGIKFPYGKMTTPVLAEVTPRATQPTALVALKEEVARVVESVVSQFDGGQSLKAAKTVPHFRNVIAGPNQTVLLRRGNLLYALYLLGENGYVILSGSESKLVRLDDLLAMEADKSVTVAMNGR